MIVAYAQNGEALRPEQGYPVRLLVPGYEGSISVKWLRRLKVTETPYYTREETSKYTDIIPDGRAREFTFVMEAKSVITSKKIKFRKPETLSSKALKASATSIACLAKSHAS